MCCANCNRIYSCLEIIKTCSSYDNLLSTELLQVKKLQQNLNNQFGSNKTSSVPIDKYKHYILF